MGQYAAAAANPNPWCLPLIMGPYEHAPDAESTLAYPVYATTCTRDIRAMCKAVLAQAWRVGEDGLVSPDRIRQAWATVLDNERQMRSGPNAIESMIGVAFGSLTQDEARWALRRDVFHTPEQIEGALRTLQEHEVPDAPEPPWLAAEHARAMDTIQYLFNETGADGRPRINLPRARFLFGHDPLVGFEPVPEDVLARLTADDADRAIEAVDRCIRAMRSAWPRGYAAVLQAEYDPDGHRWADTNALTQRTIGYYGRIKCLQTRELAYMRATRLAYRLKLYHLNNGRWPASLDEVADDYGLEDKIDPFTGSHFGYRLTVDGPCVYSCSENGRDDGGTHSPNWGDDKKPGEGDDYVLWPLQR
jgi:hypothetical protein